jgi:hypothetical protein
MELKQTLGSSATMTVFRKLRATLADIPQFDELGLWSYRAVGFSLTLCIH